MKAEKHDLMSQEAYDYLLKLGFAHNVNNPSRGYEFEMSNGTVSLEGFRSTPDHFCFRLSSPSCNAYFVINKLNTEENRLMLWNFELLCKELETDLTISLNRHQAKVDGYKSTLTKIGIGVPVAPQAITGERALEI